MNKKHKMKGSTATTITTLFVLFALTILAIQYMFVQQQQQSAQQNTQQSATMQSNTPNDQSPQPQAQQQQNDPVDFYTDNNAAETPHGTFSANAQVFRIDTQPSSRRQSIGTQTPTSEEPQHATFTPDPRALRTHRHGVVGQFFS